MFKIYNIFFRTNDRIFTKYYNKLGIFLIFIFIYFPLIINGKLNLSEVLPIAVYYVLILNLSLVNMNGIFSNKDARNDYLKASNNSAKVLKSVMIADFIRRIFPTLIFIYITTLFAYEYHNIPAMICTLFLVLGLSQFIVFFGYFMRGSEKCIPILILGSFIMGVVLYIIFASDLNNFLFIMLSVLGFLLIIGKFVISFRKVDKLYG